MYKYNKIDQDLSWSCLPRSYHAIPFMYSVCSRIEIIATKRKIENIKLTTMD